MFKDLEVIHELTGIATVLDIKINYVVDKENNREYLVCDDTKICTNGTSISSIREEFFGYVFLKEWRNRYLGSFDKQTRNYIRQYWYDDNFKQPYLKAGR